MNSIYLVKDKVKLRFNIYGSGLKKGDEGTVIEYEDMAITDHLGESKPMNRIECMVEFKVYNIKAKKNIKVLEPFTLDEAKMFLEHSFDEDEFFE